jgi:hypothetical protein
MRIGLYELVKENLMNNQDEKQIPDVSEFSTAVSGLMSVAIPINDF